MKNRLHTTARQAGIARRFGVPALMAGILVLGSAAWGAAGGSASAAGEPNKPPQQQTQTPQANEQAQNLQEKPAGLTPSVAPTAGADVEANPPTPTPQALDERMRQLTQQREELARAIQQLQTQLKELPAGREAERTKLLEELNENQQRLHTLDEELHELQRQRIRADYLATLQACEQARCAERQNFEHLHREWVQQQRELHREVQGLSEQLKAALERGKAEAQCLQQQIDRLHMDLGGMGQTVGRMERERVEAQAGLREEVQRLHGQLDELRGKLGQMQGTLNMMLSPLGRGTVGSAGYPWGW